MHVGGLTQVPRCFLTMDTLSMQSGISIVPRGLSVRQFIQLCILPQYQSSQAVVLRS